jgi:hypothetical protein
MGLFMQFKVCYFRTTNDIIILNINSDETYLELEDVLNATDFVSEWSKNRNLDINNLSQDDIELLKFELFGFNIVNNIRKDRL